MSYIKFKHKYSVSALLVFALTVEAIASPYGDDALPHDNLDKVDIAELKEEYEKKKYDPMKFSLLNVKVGAKNSTHYNDNVFRANSGEEDDIINRLSAQALLRSNFEKHSLNGLLRVENGTFANNDENNYVDADMRLNGHYDVNDQHSLHGGVDYRYGHVGIGAFADSPDTGANEPTVFQRTNVYARHEYNSEKWHAQIGAASEFFNYNNVERRDGSRTIEDDRDRSEYSGHGQLGYELFEHNLLYVRGGYEKRVHQNRVDSSFLETRNSDQIRVSVGFMSDDMLDSTLQYNIGVGYLSHDYNSNTMRDINDVDFYSQLSWNMTDKDRLDFSLNRAVIDAYSTGISAFLRTRAQLGYTHYYNDNLTFGLRTAYSRNAFATNLALRSVDRQDDEYMAHVWGEYELISNLDLNAFYMYRDRDSNVTAADYTANIVGLGLAYYY